LATVAGVTLLGNGVLGNTLTWDASGTSAASPLDGSGTWDTGSANWSNGATDNAWVNADTDTAVFGNGGTAGNVSLAADIIAGGITFNSGYVIDATSHQLNLNGGAITLNNNTSTTINGYLSGSATVSGQGILTLTGSDDNVGLGLTVGNGAWVILAKESNPNAHAIGGSGLTIDNGGTVQLAGTGGDQIWDNADVRINSGGLFDLNGTSETILDLFGGGGTVLNNLVSTTSTLTFTGDSGDYFGQIEDNAGTGGIVAVAVNNGGAQKIESANSYSGGTTIGNGTVILNEYNSLGSGPVTLGTGSGNATLIGSGTDEFTTPIPNAINVNGAGTNIISANGWDPTFAGAITLDNTNVVLQSNNALRSNLNITGGITGSGNVTIAVLANGDSQVNISGSPVNNAGTVTNKGTTGAANISAVIGTNVTGVIQNSSGSMLILSGANTYTSATTVSSGSLVAGVASLANVSGAFGNNAAMIIANDPTASVNLNGYDTQLGSITGGGPAGGNVILGSGNLTTGGDGTSPAAYAGAISGTGGVTKIGVGTQTFTGGNSYTGSTNVVGGTLDIQNSTSLYNSSGNNSLAERISIASDATLELDMTNPPGEWALGTTGGITITGNGTLQINQTGSETNAGTIALGDQGNGRNVNLEMSGGTIDIEGGTLRNGGFSGGNWTSNHASMNIAAGGTLDLWDGNTVMVDGLTGSGTVTHTSYGSNTSLTVGVNNDIGGPATFAGTITETDGHAVSLTKTGTGVQILTGANSYSNGTYINAGELRVNNTAGSGTGSGTVVVNGGGTLGGSGSIGTADAVDGAITVNSAGVITAGPNSNTTGLLTSLSTNGLTLNGNAHYLWKINNGAGAGGTSSGWDEIATQGITFASLSSDSPFRIDITGSPTGLVAGTTTYIIATDPAGPIVINESSYGNGTILTSGATSSLFVLNTADFSDSNSPVAGATSFQLELVGDSSGQDLVLLYSATPEPETAMLLLGGATPLLISRRRKPRFPPC
jgi:autotransporter-associated beta strand protein